MAGPHSSYSCLVIHICWKVESEARMEPPIQAESVLSGGSNDLSLHGAGGEGNNFLLHPVSNAGIHGGASGQDNVGIKVLPDVNIAFRKYFT